MKDRNVITPPLHKEAEFGELYKRYKARFESFAVGYVQDRLIAEDVVTDAFIYYWENRSRLDADCNAAAYILTTIRHKCLNYLRAAGADAGPQRSGGPSASRGEREYPLAGAL